MAGAYKTGKYRNIFKEYGYPEEEIQKRVEDTFNTILYGYVYSWTKKQSLTDCGNGCAHICI